MFPLQEKFGLRNTHNCQCKFCILFYHVAVVSFEILGIRTIDHDFEFNFELVFIRLGIIVNPRRLDLVF